MNLLLASLVECDRQARSLPLSIGFRPSGLRQMLPECNIRLREIGGRCVRGTLAMDRYTEISFLANDFDIVTRLALVDDEVHR